MVTKVDRCPNFNSTSACPKYIIGRAGQGKTCLDSSRKYMLASLMLAMDIKYKSAARDGYRYPGRGCIPAIFGESATNHQMFYSRFVLADLRAAAAKTCGHTVEDSLASMLAGKYFGCGVKGFWPSETELYFMFLQQYYPGSYVTTYPAFGDSHPDCSIATQVNSRNFTDLLFLACHDKDNYSPRAGRAPIVNSHTGGMNAFGGHMRGRDCNCPGNAAKNPGPGLWCDFVNYPNNSFWFNNYDPYNQTDLEWWRTQEFTNL